MQAKSLSLSHIIRAPIENKKNPAVLFMFHGYGSNEEDLFSFAAELPDDLFIISVRAPYDLQPYGYAWYAIHFDEVDGKWSDDQQAIASRDAIASFIDEAVAAYELDATNISLLGFSQGAILSLAVAFSYPEKVKNVVALSGYVNERIINTKGDEAYSHLNIYSSHGTVDMVIPIDWARKTPEWLKKRNIKHLYEEFPIGHGVSPQNFYSFKNWLSDKI